MEWSKQRSGGETSTAVTGSSVTGTKTGTISTAASGSSIAGIAVVNTAADGSSQVFVIFLQCPEGSQQPPAFTGAQARQAPETKAVTSSITSPILAIARITVYRGNCNQRTIPIARIFNGTPPEPLGDMAQFWVILCTRMPRARYIVLLAIVLLFANTWCVAQCAVTPAPGHLPPCHRQHQTVKPCASPVLVEAPHPPVPSPLALLGPAPHPSAGPVATTRRLDPPAALVSPPAPPIPTPLRA